MSVPTAAQLVDRQAGFPRARLFLVSSLALCTAGIANAIRADTASDLQRVFLDPIDKAHSAEMIASVLGVPFLGFAITIAVSSPLLDVIGMGFLLPLSGLLISLGMLLMAFAGNLATGRGVYDLLWYGAVVAGIGWEWFGNSGTFVKTEFHFAMKR